VRAWRRQRRSASEQLDVWLRVSGEGIEVKLAAKRLTATMTVKTLKEQGCGTGETSAPVEGAGLGRG